MKRTRLQDLWRRSVGRRKVVPSVSRGYCRPSTTADAGVPYETSFAGKQVAGPASVPEQADVVIIGGGSVGCQTQYHLAKMGVTNTVLLEKHALTAGTTWHTAGLVWKLRPSDTTIALLGHTVAQMPRLEAETDMEVGWINNGGLFVANNRQRLDEYKRLMTVGSAMGVDSHVLAPSEVHKVHPLLNTTDMYGCLFSPGDGTIDPAGLCTALSRYCTRQGAKVIEGCGVTAIETEEYRGTRRVSAVVTPHGRVRTNAVVNATGAWANYIAEMAGLTIPLLAMKHAYVVTEKIPGIEMTPNVRDHDASVYLKLQGDALSVGGYEYNPLFLDKVQEDFPFGLFELDWDVFMCHIEGAINRLPELEKTGIKSTVCGPESFTPDHNPIMGEDPRLRGFYHNCGFNSSGMMLGAGCGWQLAEWIVNGRPSLDMYGFDIRRFNPELTTNKQWIKERSHEAYAKNYSMVFPHDEPLAGRNMRKDPLYQELLDAGCHYQERQGWERPGWFHRERRPAPALSYDWYGAYGTPVHQEHTYYDLLKHEYSFDFPPHHNVIRDESLACRSAAALFNMSYFAKYYVTGPDAQAAVDWIFSNDLQKPAGSVVYTCMLNGRGGIESDLTVSVLESGDGGACDPAFQGRGFYVAVGGGFAEHVRAHMMTAIQDRQLNATVTDRSTDMGLLSVQGPKSREILQSLTPTDLSNTSFPFGTTQVIDVGGMKCRALRLSFVGELGWELHVPSESLLAVYRLLKEAGAQRGLVDAGYRAMDSLSAEKGYKHWHAEIRPDDRPQEAGMLFTCKLKTAQEFEGRAAVERQKAEGVHRKLVTLTAREPVPMWGLEAILLDDQVVGMVRRAEHAFALDKMVAYGYVRHPAGEKVTNAFLREGSWALDVMGSRVQAELHLKPPFDPQNRRLQGDYSAAD
ncbi:sarcosine dehydrogenase, mitochondrial-like [Pollicipes pollicipes]|uniref:sarcosine dehydrogenase, mitochondrial-like n=1 Tax=Pollicipes pollicipes TaxID=41117 RepID=UPI001885403B|nr:sarcosine dehydrogenase, mitochondrial-like [Pollicipes pollicipes]